MQASLVAVFQGFILSINVNRSTLLLILVYAVLLLPVLDDFRVVMGDEAAYADPALRWCEGFGFTSAAWWESPDRFWACNFPLHAVVSAAWVKLTGMSSLWGLRALSMLLYLSGIVLWILGCRRAGWFKSPLQEAGFVILLFGSLYATAPSQYIRPEALGALVFGFALWGQTLVSSRAREVAAFFSGAMAALSGLQFAVALAVFAFVWWLFAETKPWSAQIWCFVGGSVSLAALVSLYSHFGVLDLFLRSTFGLGSNRAQQWHGWRDPMLWASSAVLVSCLFQSGLPQGERRWALVGLVAGPGVAVTLYSLSKYPQYYGFVAVLPACTSVAAVFPCLRVRLRTAAASLLVIAALAGFPLAALMNWNFMPSRQHDALERWIDTALGNVPAVFVDPSAYFAARHPGRLVYTQAVLPALAPAERNSIEMVVVAPDHPLGGLRKEEILRSLGGDWKLTDTFPANSAHASRFPELDFLAHLSYAGSYRFEAWQRKAKAGSQ